MKNHYKRLKVTLTVMIFVAAILGSLSLTLYKAIEIQDDYLTDMYNEYCTRADKAYRATLALDQKKDDRTASSYFYRELSNARLNYHIGFYAVLTNLNGNVLANTQNMLIVDNETNDTQKYILLGGQVDEHSIKYDLLHYINSTEKVHIKGYEDESFIYPEKITFECLSHEKKHTLTLSNNNVPSDAKKIDYKINGYYLLANDRFSNKNVVNNEAKTLVYDVIKNPTSDDNVEYENKNIFKTTIILKDNHNNGMGYYNVYSATVIHPFEMAVKELMLGIVLIVFAAIVLIIIINILINKTIKQQEKYDQMRNNFTSGVAHEFKTPLALIKSYTENWDYREDEDKPLYSTKINNEVDKLSDLVTDFLELSRLEANKRPLNFETIDLVSLTNAVINSLRPIIAESNLDINFKHNESEILIDADLEMIKTVIQNFVTNAIKHATNQIIINVEKSSKGVSLSVSNNGEMINKTQIEKIWDVFYKTELKKHNRLGSSGIGLSIAKNILMLHHFEHGCNSNKELTTFWFKTK